MKRRFELECLEGRSMLSVTLAPNGVLSIIAPLNSGNSAIVSLDTPHNAVKVTLNGTSQEFPASQVTELAYFSGMGGGDTYINSTNILSVDIGYNGNNTFIGGTGEDVMFLYGTNNTALDFGGNAFAFTYGASSTDTIGSGVQVLN